MVQFAGCRTVVCEQWSGVLSNSAQEIWVCQQSCENLVRIHNVFYGILKVLIWTLYVCISLLHKLRWSPIQIVCRAKPVSEIELYK